MEWKHSNSRDIYTLFALTVIPLDEKHHVYFDYDDDFEFVFLAIKRLS